MSSGPSRPSKPLGTPEGHRPLVRDPRSDSSPPSAREENPLGAHRGRQTSDPMAMRVAGLEAEVERLRAQHASDSDHIADMLLSLADAEKRKADSLARASEAEHRLAATRAATAAVLNLLEDLERREEMATGVRARTIDEARRTLTSERPGPMGSRGIRSSPPEPDEPPASGNVVSPRAGSAPVEDDPLDLFGELPGQRGK